MTKGFMDKIFGLLSPTEIEAGRASRRAFLVGAGAVVGALCVSARFDEARAAQTSGAPSIPDLQDAGDDAEQFAQNRRRDDDRDDRRGDDWDRRRGDDRDHRRRNDRDDRRDHRRDDRRDHRRGDDWGRRGDDRRRRRHDRRELEVLCRRDRRFRHENRRLCERVTGRSFGRRGTCIEIGPLTICE